MLGKTHALGGSAMALGGYMVMREVGLLNLDLEPIAQILCIFPYAVWASTVPDLDQDNKEVAMSNPINLALQQFFNLIGAGHRSFKSHVYPAIITSVVAIINIIRLQGASVQSKTSDVLYCMVMLGIALGLLSHTLLDMCTKDGLRLNKRRYAFVPESDFFKTGGLYERYVRYFLYVLNVILFGCLFLV